MTDRMAKLDRLLALVHALSETTEGLTLDEMAERLGVNRRTAERMRDIIARHFDLEEIADDRRKRFVIRDSLRRIYTRPTAAEVAALQAEVDSGRVAGQAPGVQLASLLTKVKGAFDDREKRRIDPDLDALARLQRTMVTAGPIATVAPTTFTTVQTAILAGCCLEFEYATDERPEPRWRRVVPYGLVHGPLSYLLGKMPGRDDQPVYFRLDRMIKPRLSETLGSAPDEWDIDAWLADSFAVWRDEKRDVVLHVPASSAVRARGWRFHRLQQIEELADGGLYIRFSTGGMRELAEHLFTWGGELVIEGPDVLIETMRERIAAAQMMLPAQVPTNATTNPVVIASNRSAMTVHSPTFLPGVPEDLIRVALLKAGGNEIASGKLDSPESSAALAVNTFGWFLRRPQELPPFPPLADVDWPATQVDVERQMRFPWRGGRHPWLDAAVETRDCLIGVESKRFEPFRDTKTVSLSDAYDRDVWGDRMAPFADMRDALRAGTAPFVYLDAAQLVKHAFGLVSEGRRIGKAPVLLYLYAEPAQRGAKPITAETLARHRGELATFTTAVAGAEVRFAGCSYREWFETWTGAARQHADALIARFNP